MVYEVLGVRAREPKTQTIHIVHVFMWFLACLFFSVEREQSAPPHTHAPYGLELVGTASGDTSDMAGFYLKPHDSEIRSGDGPTAPCAVSAVSFRLQCSPIGGQLPSERQSNRCSAICHQNKSGITYTHVHADSQSDVERWKCNLRIS